MRKYEENKGEREKEVTSINGRIGLRPVCTLAFRVITRFFRVISRNVSTKIRNRSISWSLNDRAKMKNVRYSQRKYYR